MAGFPSHNRSLSKQEVVYLDSRVVAERLAPGGGQPQLCTVQWKTLSVLPESKYDSWGTLMRSAWGTLSLSHV